VAAVDASDATEPVEAFLSPEKDIDSLVFRVEVVTVEDDGPEGWRGTREDVNVEDGEARTETRRLGVAATPALGASASLSSTPNSFITFSFVAVRLGEGDPSTDAFAAASVLALTLTRRFAVDETEPFKTGDDVSDVRPVMRGILVGVSLVSEELNALGGGMLSESLSSLCVLATEGDPAIVGS
jgi:hypothetical protein